MAFRRLLTNNAIKRNIIMKNNNTNNLNSRVKPLMFRRNFAVGPKDGALKPVYDTIMKNNTTYIFTIVAVAAVAGVGFNGAVDMMWETANRGKIISPWIGVYLQRKMKMKMMMMMMTTMMISKYNQAKKLKLIISLYTYQ